MHRKYGNLWVKYRDPIDLMDCPSTMEFGYVGYPKGTNNKWTYNLTDHLMIYLKKICISFYDMYRILRCL